VKAFHTIRLSKPVKCEGYDGKASEFITHRVEFFLKMDSHVERTMAYVVNSCGLFDLVLGFRWRQLHQPQLDYRKGTIEFTDEYCRLNCCLDESTPLVICKGGEKDCEQSSSHDHDLEARTPADTHPSGAAGRNNTSKRQDPDSPSSNKPPIESDPEKPKKPPDKPKVDIQKVSLRSIRLLAKKYKTDLCFMTIQEHGTTHFRRAAADEDFAKFMEKPPNVTLKDILTPELFEEYADYIPVFDKEAAAKQPDHSEHDHEIQLEPGAKIPNHRPRPFSGRQEEAIAAYVKDMESR
jgi:hypothetical protein